MPPKQNFKERLQDNLLFDYLIKKYLQIQPFTDKKIIRHLFSIKLKHLSTFPIISIFAPFILFVGGTIWRQLKTAVRRGLSRLLYSIRQWYAQFFLLLYALFHSQNIVCVIPKIDCILKSVCVKVSSHSPLPAAGAPWDSPPSGELFRCWWCQKVN